MAQVKVISCVCLILFLGMVFQGVDGRRGRRWSSGHATFYGANQSPATLGKSIYIQSRFNIFFPLLSMHLYNRNPFYLALTWNPVHLKHILLRSKQLYINLKQQHDESKSLQSYCHFLQKQMRQLGAKVISAIMLAIMM